jgi:ATP-binding protein involved in chromosome partitioning
VEWGELDYLFVDLPPGTGDVHLTLVQSVPVTGAVIISTPQDVGLTISMKTYRMFVETKVQILGIIENMSYHICSHCGEREEIFGHGIVAKAAERLQIPFLGEIPLDRAIREQADNGSPVVLSSPESPSGKAFERIVEKLAAQISIANFNSRPLEILEE